MGHSEKFIFFLDLLWVIIYNVYYIKIFCLYHFRLTSEEQRKRYSSNGTEDQNKMSMGKFGKEAAGKSRPAGKELSNTGHDSTASLGDCTSEIVKLGKFVDEQKFPITYFIVLISCRIIVN